MLSSAVGSVYTVLAYISNNEFFQSIIMKIMLSIIMLHIAYKTNNIKELLKKIIYFYLTSFVFGGGALAIIYVTNTGKISVHNGVIFGKYTLLTIMIGVIVSFIVIIISFTLVKNKISKKDIVCNITIRINDKKIKTKALIDTGNFLKDPITNIPVIVEEQRL